jgi:SAM-dependent methyltransferase
MRNEVDALIEAASRPYRNAGLYAYHFARNKLKYDPVFFSVLRMGCIPDRARVLDLGCGHAVLASLMLAARAQFESGYWPSGWAAPPSQLQLHGIEMERRAVQRAQTTLGHRATIHAADLRDARLPEADVVFMIDVLHYLETPAQISLLGRAAQSLHGGGLLILRVADISAGWRYHAGKAADRLGSLTTALALPRHHHRPIDEWVNVLGDLGFTARVRRDIVDRSFANLLVSAKLSPPPPHPSPLPQNGGEGEGKSSAHWSRPCIPAPSPLRGEGGG